MQLPSTQAPHRDVPLLPKAIISRIPTPLASTSAGALAWKPAAIQTATVQRQPAGPARCSEKGCVFPESPGNGGKCLHHLRQSQEPILFSSCQPTRAVLERGRFGLSPQEVDSSRNGDRRRMAAIREAFLED